MYGLLVIAAKYSGAVAMVFESTLGPQLTSWTFTFEMIGPPM